ncbi:alpha/beta fold hydrolase [Hoyosella rhizosphaerae]|uniref:Alpha/beta hydrolase n=1 Tax=Hoyosella rhizosphaerae TaxID=1755582 RepID=A0A916UAD1_9ACTN|nr:alpha/beta fold hydrolase [Hoyosella rhizosphaerae]MBN4926080.1 alpha/beta fold hydrolase [Hoyosella rhizosphaerae]GGC65731.1 alpha/beta hydrolase [Hoyosella rhizosphaerae]
MAVLTPLSPARIPLAAANLSHKALYHGVADLRPMPRTLIDAGPQRQVYRYLPAQPGTESTDAPVLLVPPLAVPDSCFDLRRGCSVAEHLVEQGRRTYVVDYGQISFAQRNLGLEHWIHNVLPKAIHAASIDAGGAPVHLVSWSLGGIFCLLTAADLPTLPIASITTIGTPVDFAAVPIVAPARPVVALTRGAILTNAARMLGGAPRPFVKRAFQLTSLTKNITKPFTMLARLDDTEYLAQLEAVDAFTEHMTAYPGRAFSQLYQLVFRANQLAKGHIDLGDRCIDLARIRVPVLVVAGTGDAIAPQKAVRPLVDLLTSAPYVRYETAPGGHLGVLTGRAARTTTWATLAHFFDQVDEIRSLRFDRNPTLSQLKDAIRAITESPKETSHA